ncbi:unnamed protein product [Orchesella dallaii]|uniref:Uncharacterized protein n=1 Tax=Orchesella dallaii TaxID=48710 RepID=A0ABP1S553_9HEXA
MTTLSSKLFLRGVILAFLVGITVQSTEGLKCWVCEGYDTVEYQCSPENKGELRNCTGSTPTCELKEEINSIGDVYISRKCANGTGNAPRPGTCAPSEKVSEVNTTRCYCNDKDNCNYDRIDGRGGATSRHHSDDGGSNGLIIAFVIIIVVVALLLVGGLGYRWYSGRSRRSGMEVPIPNDE